LHDRHIHRIKGEREPDRAAEEYENDLRSFFDDTFLPSFGLIFLGIGKDGHTASLLPESHVLKEKHRLVAYVKNKKTEYPRITLTLPVINNAENIIFLVGGKDKAPAVKRVVEERDPSLPASLVDPVKGNLFFLLDKVDGSTEECSEFGGGLRKDLR
jgi:6-phosphogluconolactonase